MANYANLKSDIAGVIRTNNNEEITGDILQEQLFNMVDELGAGYQYMGIAVPTTNPGSPDANVFYIASTAGTYTNFGGLVVADGEVAILKYNGTWTKEVTGAATAAQVTQLGQKLPEVTEEGFFIADENWNVAAKYDDDGFDVAKVSEHFIELLIAAGVGGFPGVIMNTVEPGFFIVDGSLNVAFSVTSAGVRGVGIVPYEIS